MALHDELFRRLMTDWQRKDGASKAGEALDDMDYPSLVSVLPYQHYDKDSGLFVNQNTMGFILECTPLIGANDGIVEALDNFLRNKLPREQPLSVLLLGSKCVSHLLDNGLSDMAWQGEQAKRFDHITRAFYEHGALYGLPNNKGYPLSLRNYRLFISYAEPLRRDVDKLFASLGQTLSIVQQSLFAANLHSEVLDDRGLVGLVREIVNFRHDRITPPSDEVDPYEELNTQCVARSINLKVTPDCLHQSQSSAEGGRVKTRIMSYMPEKNPVKFALWQGGNNLSNLLDPTSTVPCPFAITLTTELDVQAKSQNEAVRKFATNDKRANSPFGKWVPGVKKAAREWDGLRERLSAGQSALARYSLGVTLFCEDDNDKALMCELALQNTFRANGISLCSPTFMQLRNWLSLFPFMMPEGLWSDMRRSGATLRAESFNVANLLPVVADNRICPKGVPIPSYRNQLSYLDLFDSESGLGNDNYNLGVCGTSGGGKSFLMQTIIRQILDSGGRAWVFDMGDSYKALCANVGGVYVDATDLKFNPFAGIVNIVESAESIRDLLLVLSSPSGKVDDTAKSILLNAVQAVWEGEAPSGRKGNAVLIDDVSDLLNAWTTLPKYKDATTVRNLMEEMVVSLHKYTTGGIYGEYFNSPKPALDDNVRFCVLEMGRLKNKPDLLAAIMFSMMIYVEQRMFLSPRSERKAAIIDEAWKLLASENGFIGDFIENGYRTARKYGGAYITITQGIEDFDGDKASIAAKAAWSNSSFKIILRQNREAFRKYNQKNEGQFSSSEQTIIEGFPSAKDAHFSAFMLRVAGQVSYHRLILDPLSRVMFSSDGDDFEFREQCLKGGKTVHEALWLLARKKYAKEMEVLEQWQIQS